MIRQVAALACLLLAGCAQDRLTVAPIDIADRARFLQHIEECQTPARAYNPPLTIGQVIFGGISGALDVASYAFLYPMMPLAGGAAGAAKAAIAPFDPRGQARQNVFRHCVTDKVNADRSATIANPDN